MDGIVHGIPGGTCNNIRGWPLITDYVVLSGSPANCPSHGRFVCGGVRQENRMQREPQLVPHQATSEKSLPTLSVLPVRLRSRTDLGFASSNSFWVQRNNGCRTAPFYQPPQTCYPCHSGNRTKPLPTKWRGYLPALVLEPRKSGNIGIGFISVT